MEYEINDRFRVGGNFTYINLGDIQIDQSRGPARLVGDYDANAYIFGLYGSIRF